jgi:hypothetical protein
MSIVSSIISGLKDVITWMWSMAPSSQLVSLYESIPDDVVAPVQPLIDALITANHYLDIEMAFNLTVGVINLKIIIILIKWVLKFIPTMGG